MLPSAGPGSENAAANAAVGVTALEVKTDRSVCDVEGAAGGKSGSVVSATVADSEIGNVAIMLPLIAFEIETVCGVEVVAGGE